jgi:surface protein
MLGLGLKINKASAVPSYFISSWKTDNTSSGSSTDHQVKLPLEATGTYDFVIDWGDGNKDHITTYNQAEVTHTYTTIGTYTVKIRGLCKGFRFNDVGDKLKLLNISNWGNLELGNSNSYFYGCTNLNITSSNKLKNPTMTTLLGIFRNCINFNSDLNWLNSVNITTMKYMFTSCQSFNKSVGTLNTANVIDMSNMFYRNYDFNQDVSSFNTTKVLDMQSMFYYCTSFNQDISSWDFTAVLTMANMFAGATSWSTTNYDKFLISAAAQAVQSGVQFDCATKYTSGGAVEAARTYLQGTKGWTINDGGAV